MKKYVLMFVLVIVSLVSVTAFANDEDKKTMLKEKAARIQAEYALGKSMMDKAQLEFANVDAEIKALESQAAKKDKKEKEK